MSQECSRQIGRMRRGSCSGQSATCRPCRGRVADESLTHPSGGEGRARHDKEGDAATLDEQDGGDAPYSRQEGVRSRRTGSDRWLEAAADAQREPLQRDRPRGGAEVVTDKHEHRNLRRGRGGVAAAVSVGVLPEAARERARRCTVGGSPSSRQK